MESKQILGDREIESTVFTFVSLFPFSVNFRTFSEYIAIVTFFDIKNAFTFPHYDENSL